MDDQSPRSEFLEFVKTVQQSIKKMTTMEIKTIVGDFALGADEEVTTLGGDYKVMESQFNLLLGDVTVKIDQALLDPQYDWVRNFHAQKEQQGHSIIQNNINLLLTLINLYRQTFKEQQAAGYMGGGPVVNTPIGGGNTPNLIGGGVIGTVIDGIPTVVANPPDLVSPIVNMPTTDASPIVNMPVEHSPGDGYLTNNPPVTDVFGNPIGTVPGQ